MNLKQIFFLLNDGGMVKINLACKSFGVKYFRFAIKNAETSIEDVSEV